MNLHRSLNPDRKSRRELDRYLLYPTLIEDVTPTKTSKKRAERERNSGNRRPHRRVAQLRISKTPTTSSTTATRPSTPASGLPSSKDFITNTTRPDHSVRTRGNSIHTRQVGIPVEPSNRLGYSQETNHNMFAPGSFTVTTNSIVPQFNSQDPNSTLTAEDTNVGLLGIDGGNLVIEPSPTVYETDPNFPSAFKDLVFSSSGDLWNAFRPQDMSPAELDRHMEETAREVQRRAAPPPTVDPNPDQEGFSAKLTFDNGYTSHETILFNEEFEVNFVSQGYLNKLRTTSGKPPCLVPAPPIYREVLTPDGILAPIRYLLYADLEWESPDLPFPPRQLCFVHYSGNGDVHDTKLILGQSWFKSTEEQALARN